MNYKITGNTYYLGWKNPGGWFRIAEIISSDNANAVLMEFNFMTTWTHESTSSSKVEIGWFNRHKVILENTKNILNSYGGIGAYSGIRIYKSNGIADTIYIDVHVPQSNHIMFEACQQSTNENTSHATILDSGLKMDDDLDTSVYTVLKQIDITTTSDTYTSTLSRISTLESKVSALESSGS